MTVLHSSTQEGELTVASFLQERDGWLRRPAMSVNNKNAPGHGRKAYWYVAKNGHVQRQCRERDSHESAASASLTSTSPCNYTIKLPRTGWYAQ